MAQHIDAQSTEKVRDLRCRQWRRFDRQTATAACTTSGHRMMMAAVLGDTSWSGQIPR